MDAQELINEFNSVKNDKNIVADERNKRLNDISEKLINMTIDCYDNTAEQYSNLRSGIGTWDQIIWSTFTYGIELCFGSDKKGLKVLDIGASMGRDLIHGESLGYDMQGAELSDGFLSLLDAFYKDGRIKNKVKKCDMRSLDFQNESFDAISHIATLLHMPVIGKGYTTDKALEEAWRVLKRGGMIYVVAKEGDPQVRIHDTKEGLGARVFQYFSMELLCDLLKRNGFEIVLANKLQEVRPKEVVDTLIVVGRKIS